MQIIFYLYQASQVKQFSYACKVFSPLTDADTSIKIGTDNNRARAREENKDLSVARTYPHTLIMQMRNYYIIISYALWKSDRPKSNLYNYWLFFFLSSFFLYGKSDEVFWLMILMMNEQ